MLQSPSYTGRSKVVNDVSEKKIDRTVQYTVTAIFPAATRPDRSQPTWWRGETTLAKPNGCARCRSIRSGSVWEEEIVNRRKNGELYVARQTIVPVENGDGEYFVAIQTDITELREHEEQINVLNRILRHNLRNELTIIRGYVASISEHDGADWAAVDVAIESIDRLIDLSEKLRKFISYTEPDVRRQAVDVPALLDTIVTRIEPAYPEATVSIDCPAELSLDAYPSLELAVVELLENAVKHSGETPTVDVTVTVDEDLVGITVADDGPGLPEQERKTLVEKSETALVHGSGLGLWIVELVTSDHGGSLNIDASDSGTAITMSLPRTVAESKSSDLTSEVARGLQVRERYRSVFENSLDAMLIVDDDGHITDANTAAAKLLGDSQRDLLGRELDEFLPDMPLESSTRATEDRQQFTLVRRDGEERIVEYTFVEDVILDRFFFVLRDVTEREARDRELAERLKELTAIREATILFESGDGSIDEQLAAFVEFLPSSFQYPDITAAKITYGENTVSTANFEPSDRGIAARTTLVDGSPLALEVVYLEDRTPEDVGPFLSEERALLETLVKLVKGNIERVEHVSTLETVRKWYQSILEHSSDYVMIVDGMLQVSYVSPAVERVVGYAPEELEGTNPFDHVLEADLAHAVEAFSEVIESPDDVTVQFRSIHKDGSTRWLEVRGRNRLDDPVINGVLVNVRDITARKEREFELEQVRETFERYVENASDIITVVDETGVIKYNSQAVDDILGYDPESLVGACVFDYLHPDDRDELMAEFLELVDDPAAKTERVEYRFEHADGSWVWLESIGSNQMDSAVDGYVINSREITDRKEWERELKRHATFLQHSPDVVLLLDEQGIVTYQSHADETLFDYEPIDLTGASPFSIIHPADRDRVAGDFQTLLEHPDELVRTEYRIELQDGDSRWLENISRNLLDDPIIEGILVTVRDIDERKAYEQRLETQRDDIELLNEVLRHDIRNDLSVMQGYAELLDDHVDADGRTHLEVVTNSMRNAIELTLTARDLSTVLLGNGRDDRRLSLTNVLTQQVAEIGSAHPDATVALTEPVPEIEVVANDMLESVFRNLLRNAIQHNHTDEPTVRVSIEERAGSVVVRVGDNGPGISDAQKETIFEQGTAGLETGGTGLGLYLVARLVHGYGGDVWAEDNEPSGAVFVVELPLAE